MNDRDIPETEERIHGNLSQALVWNVGTCRSDDKGEIQVEGTTRMRVRMRSTRAEQSVVGRKVLQWDWTEGAALFSFILGSTGNGRNLVDKAKPLCQGWTIGAG